MREVAKDYVKFHKTPMSRLVNPISNMLTQNQIHILGHKILDDKMTIGVTDGTFEADLTLQRYSRNPLEIEIMTDKLVRRSNQKQTGLFSERYMIWLIIIFAGVILSSLIFLIQSIVNILATIFFNSLLNIVILVLALLFFVRWINSSPNKATNQYEFNRHIVNLTKTFLTSEYKTSLNTSTIRCWSCLVEIETNSDFCSDCGAKQN